MTALAGRWINTADYHTAGEPFRIVTEGYEAPAGDTVGARRVAAIANEGGIDDLRKLLCFEPRGHADMYGGFIMPADDDGAHFGVLFWHKDGFSTACGHGTIALGVWAIESGRITPDPSGTTDVIIDVPSGRVTARVHTSPDDTVENVDFINVPGYVLHTDVPVQTARGEVSVDVTYGGAIYAQLDARSVGLEVTPEHYSEIIAIGREIKWALNDTPQAVHPDDHRLSGIYGTIVYESFPDVDGRVHQRNATVFADGEVDRSPCGSGTSARIATLTTHGTLAEGEELLHRSIVGSRFIARAIERGTHGAYESVTPKVTGTAFKTGEHAFTVDPRDELTPGFVLR